MTPTLLTDQVYATLHAAIISGELPAGSRLRIRDLAEQVGTSVMPVREAIRRLEQAGLAERDRSDWRKAVVIATGRDGTRTVFSWPELTLTAAGTEAMVAYERDVAPLPASDGPLALHVPGDERSIARDVKQLQRIEVRILRD